MIMVNLAANYVMSPLLLKSTTSESMRKHNNTKFVECLTFLVLKTSVCLLIFAPFITVFDCLVTLSSNNPATLVLRISFRELV